MNFFSLCVNCVTFTCTCQFFHSYDHYFLSDWGTNTHTHIYIIILHWYNCSWAIDATDNRLYCFILFSYNTILLIVCGESMFIHGKVSTLLTKKQKQKIQMHKHFSITCINIISLYSWDCGSSTANAPITITSSIDSINTFVDILQTICHTKIVLYLEQNIC